MFQDRACLVFVQCYWNSAGIVWALAHVQLTGVCDMDCPTDLSVPQLAFARPENLEFFLGQIGVLCVIDSFLFAYAAAYPSRRQIRGSRSFRVLFILGNLLPQIGYYVMFGMAAPWQRAVFAWLDRWDPLDCVTPSLEAAYRSAKGDTVLLFLLGVLVAGVGYVFLWLLIEMLADLTPPSQKYYGD